MKRIVFLVLSIFLVFPLSAQIVDFDLAKQKAQAFFFVNDDSGSLLKSATEVKVDSCTTFYVKGGLEKSGKTESEPALYVINRKDKPGFIVISAELRTPAFLSYSLDDTFHKDSIPPAYEEWLNSYVEQIEYLKGNSVATDSFANSEWNSSVDLELQNSLKSANAVVSPLLDKDFIKWNQDSPYNLKCPEDPYGPGGHTWLGCTAVAMGQIMKYWEYPPSSNEIPGYQDWDNLDDDDDVIPGSNYGYIAGISKTVYNWDNIPNQASDYSSQTEKDAVSEFLYNVAVSVQMNFGPEGSSAGFSTTSFTNYFKYLESPEIITRYSGYGYRYISGTSEWIDILKNEINNGRPVLYAGKGSGSHAFVCDGYDVNNKFHFNWGWDGYGDCYCSLYYLWPDNDYNNGDFSDRQYAMIGITPPNIPSLSVQPSSISFNKLTVNTSSAPQSFTLNGNKLTSNILITAPTGFEVSRYSGSEYGSSLSITPSNGVVSNATIYVRFSPTELETKAGEILISSSGAFPRNISVNGTGIGEAPQNLVSSAGDGSITLSWTAPTSFSPVSYTVYWSSTENGTYSNVGTTSNTTMGMTASNGNIYWFYVVANYSNGASNPSIKVSAKPGSISPPTITVSTTSLPDFGNIVVSSVSSPQSFTVSGNNLTTDILLTAPTGFEISKSSGSGYQSSLNLAQSGGTVSNTTIYVRFKPTTTGIKTGNIAITSTGAETKNVAVSGTGTAVATPSIMVSTNTISDFGNVVVNTTSAAQSFTVSGSNLKANISLSAPTGFEISKSSGSGYQSSLSLTQSGGTISNTRIYVRFKPTSTGTKSGNIVITSTGAETKNVAVSGTGTTDSNCVSPVAKVNSPRGVAPLTFTCSTLGGSGGNIAYKWYKGTSCAGTVIGTSQTLIVNENGYFSCKAYIEGNESTCFDCGTGEATIESQMCTNWTTTPETQNVPVSGGKFEFLVSSTGGTCSRNTNSNDSWIHSVNYIGGGYWEYTVDANNTGNTRTGSISVNDLQDGINDIIRLTVTQAGTTQPPAMTISATSLPNFGNVLVNTTSSTQSFTVLGNNLTANISLSAPTGFEISKNSGSGYGSSLSLTQSGGTVSTTTIYVRFRPTTTGIKSGNIVITSTGAATKNVAVSGTGVATCTPPVSPTSATASKTTITSGQSTTLQVNGGALNSAPEWVWFTDACGVNKVGTGITLTVSPSKTTTYYVQAKACDDSTACRFVTITVTGENPNSDDFYIQNADVTPNVIKAGGTIDVNCTQCYRGSKADVNMGSSYIGYFLSKDASFSSSSDTELGTDSSGLGSDDPCNSEDATLTIPSGTQAGTYYILFVADYDGRFSESNESNNVLVVKITVTQAGNCNLSLSKSSLDFTSSSGNNTVNVTSNSSWTVSDDASWITVSPASGSNNGTLTVSVSANSGSQRSGTVTVVTGCGTTKEITVNQKGSSSSVPAITVSITTLPDFGNVKINTSSPSQSFTVSGSNLTDNISITAPAGFGISKSSGSGFTSTLNLTQSGGTVPATTIYIRFRPTSTGLQSGNVSITSEDATSKNVAVQGTGANTVDQEIEITPYSLNFDDTKINTPSESKKVTITGNNLTSNISVSVSSEFKVSLNPFSGFTTSVNLPQTGGKIYASFNPLNTGEKSGSITISSSGAGTKTISMFGKGVLTTAIGDVSLLKQVKVYPNPTTGILNIEGLPENEMTEITLYNLNSKLVKKQISYTSITQLNISEVVSGVYLLVLNDRFDYAVKIIKR